MYWRQLSVRQLVIHGHSPLSGCGYINWAYILELRKIATIDGKIDFPQLFAKSMVALLRFDATYLYDYTLPLLWPMAVGSLPTAICVWVGVYFAIKPIVIAYQSKRESRRARFGKDS